QGRLRPDHADRHAEEARGRDPRAAAFRGRALRLGRGRPARGPQILRAADDRGRQRRWPRDRARARGPAPRREAHTRSRTGPLHPDEITRMTPTRSIRPRSLRRLAAIAFALTCALACAAPAGAAGYPERPVTIVVPFAPGGANDVVVRAIQQ